ncbi:hypothetical protein DW083_04655 [Parabacteroides sp. AF48-14]|nr:hypothetical protein DW083_04655 [Parabacteroides sp. AF48-14]
MASCSKDETIDYSQMGPVDAYVSFGVTAALQTKATDPGTGNEGKVKKLTALIYKGEGDAATFAASKTEELTAEDIAAGKTITEIKHITVKVTPNADGTSSNDVFTAVFLGNCELNGGSAPATLGALKETVLTKKATAYTIGTYLPMVSKTIKIEGLKPTIIKNDNGTTYWENWVKDAGGVVSTEAVSDEAQTAPTPPAYKQDDHVLLTRLISRVEVESVTLSITEYPNATIELTGIALANVKNESTFVGGYGSYVKGYESAKYEASQYWIDPACKGKTDNSFLVSYGGDNYKTTGLVEKKISFKDNKFQKYIFSNVPRTTTEVKEEHKDGIYETGVILIVNFTNAAGESSTRHLRVLLKDNTPTSVPEVLKNNIYKLNITITGEGSPNEDEILLNTHVAATIEVAPWNVIEQTEDDAN